MSDAPDATGIETAQQLAMQAALQASQEQAVRQCLAALDTATRSDVGDYAQALTRLRDVCRRELDRLP
jgi:hypothetical protein